MKVKFIGLAWAACVLLGGSSCSKQEIKGRTRLLMG